MIPSPPSNGMRTKGSCPTPQDWSPPALLVEAAADDDGLIIKLIEAFSEDTADRIERMREALKSADFPGIRAQAHTIKGSASQMGSDALATACRELEMVCNLREAPVVATFLDRIQELFDEAKDAMATYANDGHMESPLVP